MELLKIILHFILVIILIFALLIGDIILICLIENWILKTIITGISGVLLLSIAFIYLAAEEKFYFNKNELKIINKCKILKAKIDKLIFGI